MSYAVAAVSFLNTIPLIDWFEQTGDPRVTLSCALPSLLADTLNDGRADVALLPVVEIFRGASGGMLSATGIACRGRVDSVKLFHRGDPADLKTVAVDRGSRTSVALLRILLAEQFSIRPPFTETEPVCGWRPEVGQGTLVIGDRCFEFERDLRETGTTDVFGYDLGQAWLDLTGLPFVFAAWAVAPDFTDRFSENDLGELADLLTTARDHGMARLGEIAAREAAAGRLGHMGEATPAALDYYFRHSLRYVLGDYEMAGLLRFHQYCVQYGVVPDGSAPSIIAR